MAEKHVRSCDKCLTEQPYRPHTGVNDVIKCYSFQAFNVEISRDLCNDCVLMIKQDLEILFNFKQSTLKFT